MLIFKNIQQIITFFFFWINKRKESFRSKRVKTFKNGFHITFVVFLFEPVVQRVKTTTTVYRNRLPLIPLGSASSLHGDDPTRPLSR